MMPGDLVVSPGTFYVPVYLVDNPLKSFVDLEHASLPYNVPCMVIATWRSSVDRTYRNGMPDWLRILLPNSMMIGWVHVSDVRLTGT